MPFDAKCYLVASAAGEQEAHLFPGTSSQEYLDVPNLCRLIAYQAQAIQGSSSLLDTANFTVVSLTCSGFIVAAVTQPSYIMAETLFELQLLAGQVRLASATVVPSAGNYLHKSYLTHSLQEAAAHKQLDVQQLKDDWQTCWQGRRAIHEISSVFSVQIKQYDLLGSLSQVAFSELAEKATAADSCSMYLPGLEAAVELACQTLTETPDSDSARQANPKQSNSCMQLAGMRVSGKRKVSFATAFFKQNGSNQAAAIKCLKLSNKCTFIIAWFKPAAHLSVAAGQQLSSIPCIFIGKAAMPIELRMSLACCARLLKRLMC
ncbi:TPA: hypothetical protein ACH3X2_001863 [Trebouxia sp. C0005]